jgi:hypothetical protein
VLAALEAAGTMSDIKTVSSTMHYLATPGRLIKAGRGRYLGPGLPDARGTRAPPRIPGRFALFFSRRSWDHRGTPDTMACCAGVELRTRSLIENGTPWPSRSEQREVRTSRLMCSTEHRSKEHPCRNEYAPPLGSAQPLWES